MKLTVIIWKTAFAFLIVSGAIGVLMRLQFFFPVTNINYQYFIHTHSHVILLGWVFNALIAAMHYMLFRNEQNKRYFRLFLAFQISILGMLFSFPVQGYAAVSITFSTLHILLSYVWAVWTWKRAKSLSETARKFVRWGLIYLAISTIGPFALGPIIANGGSGSDWYFMAIYFYLHFLYNGTFIFILLGMFFWFLDNRGISYDLGLSKWVLKLMNISCWLGLTLSALWMKPQPLVFVIGGLAGLLQLSGVICLWKLIRPTWKHLLISLSGTSKHLLKVVFLAFIIKVLLQSISALPAIAELAYQIRNYIIGYLHLVFLGVITPFLFAWFNMNGLFSLKTRIKRFGFMLFAVGVVASELVIIGQIQLARLSVYYELLFAVSLMLWLGLIFLFPARKLA